MTTAQIKAKIAVFEAMYDAFTPKAKLSEKAELAAKIKALYTAL